MKLNYIVQFVKDILRTNFVLNLTRWKSYLVNLKVIVIFLAILKNCNSCIQNYELTSKCKHFRKRSVIKGSPSRRRDDEEILVGSKHSFANSQQRKYVKCGFCGRFYLKRSVSHSCFLKQSDSIFGTSSRCSSMIKSHNVPLL